MRRSRKVLVFVGSCALALFLTIQQRGEQIRLGGHGALQAASAGSALASGGAGGYDLSQLPVLGRALYHVNNDYFDKTRLDPRRMLVGALDFVQRDVPEILVDRSPERDPRQVTVKVNGHEQTFSIENVDSPWSLRPRLQQIFRFIQPHLQPVPPRDQARRLLDIEMTATNGMLSTLDPHSQLLDVGTFKDMRVKTQGKFGGLGILIGQDRDGRIIVRRPIPDTPAARSGLKARDHIARIDGESTVNMTIEESMERLRGEPGAPVDVYIERAGEKGLKKITVVRDIIREPAIEPPPRVLTAPAVAGQPPVKIGYFRIANFSANTDADVSRALADFTQQKVKGIIMDLRENPGGLYDQAQKVADAFIDAGILVSMEMGGQRKDERASRDDEPRLPLAVLVNQGAASASEIVAGAVKNLNRGVVIGETTFGKGSVQIVFDIASPVSSGGGRRGEDSKLGLKLTTAQYLTPGGLSIQGVGVTPDIELIPLHVSKPGDQQTWITLQTLSRQRQEADLEAHLDHPTARKGAPPAETVPYLFAPLARRGGGGAAVDEPPPRDEDPDDEGDPDAQGPPGGDGDDDLGDDLAADERPIDFQVAFARDLLAQAYGNPKSIRRAELLSSSKPFFERVRSEQDRKVAAALEKLGVDWTAAPPGAPAGDVEVSLALASGGTRAAAGDTVKVRGTVKNRGTTTVYRSRAVLHSDNPLFNETEMVFGKLDPGASKSYDVAVRVPRGAHTRTDLIRAELLAQGTIKANPAEMTLHIDGKKRPVFAYSSQTIDDVSGNRDGRVQAGERVRLLIDVKNIGQGASLKTQAVLRNTPGQDGILISAGRFETGELAPGGVRTFAFVYEVTPEFKGQEYQLELLVGDGVLGESIGDKIKIKLAARAPGAMLPPSSAASGAAANAPPPIATDGVVTVARDADVREAPAAGAPVFGRAPKDAGFKSAGKVGEFTRVILGGDRTAFIASADLRPGGPVQGGFLPAWSVTPPVLTVSAPTSVTSDVVRIKGVATDDREIKDIYIRVLNRESKLPPKKVFYLPNRGHQTKLSFETDVPLWPGSNVVQVIARETNEVKSLQTLIILQRSSPHLARKVPR